NNRSRRTRPHVREQSALPGRERLPDARRKGHAKRWPSGKHRSNKISRLGVRHLSIARRAQTRLALHRAADPTEDQQFQEFEAAYSFTEKAGGLPPPKICVALDSHNDEPQLNCRHIDRDSRIRHSPAAHTSARRKGRRDSRACTNGSSFDS